MNHPIQTISALLLYERAELKREFNRVKKLKKNYPNRQKMLTCIYCQRRELDTAFMWLENHKHIHVKS